MTSAVVVDASAFVAVLFKEAQGYEVMERWRGRPLVAPALLRYEVANVTLVKMRRHPDQARQFLKAHENFRQAEIKFLDVDFAVVLALAQRRGLTAYDASYVWLAVTRGLDLVSLDKRMLSAFEAEKRAMPPQSIEGH